MSMRDIGITDDIQCVASSLNDIFKESFELMIGSLGKHGVYYIPEIKQTLDYQQKTSEERKRLEFQASNGWMKNPTLKAFDGMRNGSLRKYKIPLTSTTRQVLLVCVECLEISAQAVNFCYEATYDRKNVSGTITSGPVIYKFSLQMRITQSLRNDKEINNLVSPLCSVSLDEKSLELNNASNFRSEVRGLRTLNFLADKIDVWMKDHFNSTVRSQLETRLLTALNKVFIKHEICEEFIKP